MERKGKGEGRGGRGEMGGFCEKGMGGGGASVEGGELLCGFGDGGHRLT